jgi:hypothetical protein
MQEASVAQKDSLQLYDMSQLTDSTRFHTFADMHVCVSVYL